MTPYGYTFLVNYPQNGTFSVQVLQIASSGAGSGNFSRWQFADQHFLSVSGQRHVHQFHRVHSGIRRSAQHQYHQQRSGLDSAGQPHTQSVCIRAGRLRGWHQQLAGALDMEPHQRLRGHARPRRHVAPWPSPAWIPALTTGTWWDTFGAGALSNFTFNVTSSNAPVPLATPPVLRSVALYVGIPAQAGITAPNLNPTAVSNAPAFNLPLVITNSGGLPLSYSLSSTSAIPAWLSFSSTNGYVSKSSALTVYLAFNPAGLAPGTYTFTLFVHTSDPSLPVTPLPISFTISSGLAGGAAAKGFVRLGRPVCLPTPGRHQRGLRASEFAGPDELDSRFDQHTSGRRCEYYQSDRSGSVPAILARGLGAVMAIVSQVRIAGTDCQWNLAEI